MPGLFNTLVRVGVALLVAKATASRRAAADAGPTSAGAQPQAEPPVPAPVPAQVHGSAPLRGTYYTISANPAFPTYHTSREYRFDTSGRFTKGSSSGGTVSGAGASAVIAGPESSARGTYAVAQGYLLLRYDNGSVERFRFRHDGDEVIWLNNTPFTRSGG